MRRTAAALLAIAVMLLVAGCEARASAPLGAPATTDSRSAAVTESPSTPDPPAGDTSEAGAPSTKQGRVVRVVDGDTAHIVVDGVREKVRFIGVDTPESTKEIEPFGHQSSAYTKKALDGRTVWLETDAELRDRYGRLLAYIWLEKPTSGSDAEIRSKMFNARLLLDGYAQVYTFPPNVRYVESFLRYQREARERDRGLWKVPGAADPLEGHRAPVMPGSAQGSGLGGSSRGAADAALYRTRTGTHYHRDGCRSLARSRIPTTLDEARSLGLTPCGACRPPG